MRLALLCALCSVPLLAGGQEAVVPEVPTVSLSARAKLMSDVLAELGEQTHILMVAYPFTAERRVTIEIKDEPLPQALDDLAVAAVATWDATYILLPQGGPFGPQDQPPCWERPPQTTVTLSGGSGPMDKITSALTALSAAPIGYVPEVASRTVTTAPAQDAPLEDVLSQIKGDHLTWTRGFWFSPVDRAAIFGRYANLPPEEREQRVLRHVEQMMRLNKADVRQALEARQREVVSLDPEERAAEIERYATEIRSGINVLNSLSPAVRDKAREAMQIFFEIGLEVYRELSEEEQLETTPIIEAMGELRR
jgi:hypothetical protein